MITVPEIYGLNPMPKAETMIDFKGAVSFDTMEMLLNQLRATSQFQEMRKIVKKRLYGTLVESIDNIYKYGAGTAEDFKFPSKAPLISVKKQGKSFVVTAGNLVLNDDVGELKFKLDRVNQLDDEGLKSLYEEIINKESNDDDKGAGLGLITMALKTRRDILYSFRAIDTIYSFFKMQITINE